jgi:cellulose biosynthesis protein BcsQ
MASDQTVPGRILSGPDQETLRRVISKTIAVSSGKGGVGKTITACNLAISYARGGLRVGLVDLDPLSDVAALLDLQDAEQVLSGREAPRDPAAAELDGCILPVFRGLEILYPQQKLGAREMAELMEVMYGRHLRQLDERYDLLLFDMPAGMSREDNLAWVPFLARLVLVTNPEPTAHASAGAYIKEVQRLFPGTPVHIWHNRYTSRLREGFHPSDVAGNYNRFVGDEDRLTPRECALLQDIAYVPEDPALDLLHGEPTPIIHVMKAMRDCLEYAEGRLLSHAARRLGMSGRVHDLVITYIQRNPQIQAPGAYIQGLGEHLGSFLASVSAGDAAFAGTGYSHPFAPEEHARLEQFIGRVKESTLRREIVFLVDALTDQIRQLEEARGGFAGRLPVIPDRAMDRELARLLVRLNKGAAVNALMRNQGILLLFYYSLHRLFQSQTLLKALRALVPRRTNNRGHRVRDRFRQIRTLVEQDPGYRQSYMKVLRSVNILVTRQLLAVADTLGLGSLLIRDGEARLDARAYLKLLTAFLHEVLYSGLSVIVGFEYRSAALAFQAGADKLLAAVRPAAPGGRAP